MMGQRVNENPHPGGPPRLQRQNAVIPPDLLHEFGVQVAAQKPVPTPRKNTKHDQDKPQR